MPTRYEAPAIDRSAAAVPSGPEADARGPRGGSVCGLGRLALNRAASISTVLAGGTLCRSPCRALPSPSLGPLGRHRFSGGSRQKHSLGLIYPAFHFYCVSSSSFLPPSLLVCFCPLLSAAPDKQASAFALRRRARRHLLPPRKAGGSALIPLALGSFSFLLHAPPHLKSIVLRTSISPHCSILFSLSATPPPPSFPLSHSPCDHNL